MGVSSSFFPISLLGGVGGGVGGGRGSLLFLFLPLLLGFGKVQALICSEAPAVALTRGDCVVHGAGLSSSRC